MNLLEEELRSMFLERAQEAKRQIELSKNCEHNYERTYTSKDKSSCINKCSKCDSIKFITCEVLS